MLGWTFEEKTQAGWTQVKGGRGRDPGAALPLPQTPIVQTLSLLVSVCLSSGQLTEGSPKDPKDPKVAPKEMDIRQGKEGKK